MTRTKDTTRVDLRELAARGTIHFVGIAGAGMSALAEMLLASGATVSGCDNHPGAVSDRLRARGAAILSGQNAAHIDASVAAVITTSAVHSDHPELVAARDANIPVFKRAAALGSLVNQGTVIGIAGTHGKTTTTAMTTTILAQAGLQPTGFVGGRVPGWDSGLHRGSDQLFVVEADEYDRSFLTLRPNIAVVTTLEADHLDIYGSLEGLEEAFLEYASLVPSDGLCILCSDDAGVRALARQLPRTTPTLTYGTEQGAQLIATDIEVRGRGSRFRVHERAEPLGELSLSVAGYHNIRNALGATAAAMHAGASFADAQAAFANFTGVDRRFQEIARTRGISIVDDYAHHPTEVMATLSAARAAYNGQRLIAVFQPHLFSRTRDFFNEFGAALALADVVIVTDVYPARELPIPGITGELVADAAIRAKARRVEYLPRLEDVQALVAAEMRQGDAIIFMGAGNIDSVAHALVAQLGANS